ncbi:acriflavine resistance protein B [Kordiimonas sediminis]|uniref:Acriflavine resistance protein B n=1 Tax=Kordiimonas sediminis TaxID=1735581 RepID=A0A919AS81_9PROT|nr:efflux RND transporter permease subunit [Kordiimonas sediminis]GHF19496.1 acriflavine resistance protein B [Kordiimonas sediminis]
MKLTKKSIHNPAAVAVVAAAVMLLGLLSMMRMPAQLFPDIEKPVMTVVNSWPGASPLEIESEISVQVEEVLEGLPGMTSMQTWNMSNFSFMQLEFDVETDMTRSLIEVISRLNRLRPLPANAEKPQVFLGEWGDSANTLLDFFVQQLPGTEDRRIENSEYLRDVIVPELMSLYGVSRVELEDGMGGGVQLQIIFDPYKAAELGIDIARVPARIGRSADISSGFVDVGSRQYTLRYEGRYDAEDLAGLILEWRDGKAIRLGDIATVQMAPGRRDGFRYHNGNEAFMLSIAKENGANVLEALDGLKARMQELNETEFKERGLYAEYTFDPSLYINRSIGLLGSNLILGVLMSVGVLWLFLRQLRATLLIALAIPTSLLATFVVLGVTGRSLNVISLAGLAFATGMVLDAAIVVLENIVRLRERGERPLDASDMGATQVWGALLASTATTVAIFIPIMFLKDAEGQMFADLALTIAIGVSVSLVVAVTILPTAARFWMRDLPDPIKGETIWDRIANRLMNMTSSRPAQLGWVAGLFSLSIALSVLFWPQSNYLPPVQRDSIDSFLFFPPGMNVETSDQEVAKVIHNRIEPYMAEDAELKVRDYFFWSFPGATGGWLSINGEDGTDLEALQALIQNEIVAGIPDLFGFTMRRSLFGGFENANSVSMQVTSKDLDAAKNAVIQGMGMVMGAIPGAIANPEPDPFAQGTELRFTPNDERLAEVGWTRNDLTMVILELGQGSWLGEYFDGQKRLDIFLKTIRFETPEEMSSLPVITPLGGQVPLGELAVIEPVPAPSAIAHYDRKRGYSLSVNPPEGMALEELIATLKRDIEPAILAQMPPDAQVKYAGSAEDLERALGTLGSNFLLAFGLLILIMAALFRSIVASLIVAFSIPLAGVGGVLAIQAVNLINFQPLDLLGMIGFIILLGLVVNNAILLVAQTQKAEERGLNRHDAVHQALRLRLRPIFMSTLTSLFGMLPLLVIPGAGSEIYRGMAAAIVGGMSVSTIFTLIMIPSLLQLTASFRGSGGAKALATSDDIEATQSDLKSSQDIAAQ